MIYYTIPYHTILEYTAVYYNTPHKSNNDDNNNNNNDDDNNNDSNNNHKQSSILYCTTGETGEAETGGGDALRIRWTRFIIIYIYI